MRGSELKEVGGLVCRFRVPEGVEHGTLVVVLLHGRGADETDLLGLAPRLPQGAIVVAPRAPFPGAAWGYGPGWAWYRFLGDDRPEPETFAESLDRLESCLAALPEHITVDPGIVVLGGFSQGGTVSIAHALSHADEAPPVVNMSGFLASHPRVQATPETAGGARFFWGHGTEDPAIPHALAVKGRAALEAAGADLTARDYPIGHWIAPEEMQDINDWIEAL